MNFHQEWATEGIWSEMPQQLEGRTGPASRPLMAIGRQTDHWETVLHWKSLPATNESATLLLAVAIEDRDFKRLHFLDANTRELLAELPVECADNYQILEIELSPQTLLKIKEHGLKIEMVEGSQPLWLFAPDANSKQGLELHLPRITSGSFDFCEAALQNALFSLGSLQAFGWKEGCVLDGLWEHHQRTNSAAALAAFKRHLNYFGFDSKQLKYETPRNIRVFDSVYGVEGTLPFAHAALLDKNHPWVDLAIKFWLGLLEENGMAHDSDVITAEGAYTVAYPMAMVGQLRGNTILIEAAEKLLLESYWRLFQSDGIYLRHFANGKRTHRNWARGTAWLLLGHAQTLRCEVDFTKRAELIQQFQTLTTYIAKYQQPNGLWACYIDEPQISADTAGSAGIAASFAIGAAEGFLAPEFKQYASRAFTGLTSQLTSEGFLRGCAQSNKDGEDLQRSNYRVISPYALGLLGFLQAALRQ